MIKSLRWKLLASYAAILSVLAVAFAGVLYIAVRGALEREVDSLLHEHAGDLGRVITPTDDGKFYLELLPEQVQLFRYDAVDAPHFRIWNAQGEVVDSSHPDLEIPPPVETGSRDRGPFREVVVTGPGGSLIVVGRNVGSQRQQLQNLATTTLAVGLGTMALLVAGGWFLTGRALKPIDRITRAAAAVSASNLSERIDPARMESELVQLTQTINDMFDRLQQAFERQTRFTADASHELRTPLSIVLSQADLTLNQDRTVPEYQHALQVIRRAARRMTTIVEGLLTLARADARQIDFDKKPLDLCQLILESCAALKPLADEKGVAIETDLEPVSVIADPDRLSDALANLLSNAIRYNVEHGRVCVKLRAEASWAVLTIADTGQGIPVADQPFVFERFYRADKSRRQSGGGSGLGLAITKWIVEGHAGEITFVSQEGRGTTFNLRIPQSISLPAKNPASKVLTDSE